MSSIIFVHGNMQQKIDVAKKRFRSAHARVKRDDFDNNSTPKTVHDVGYPTLFDVHKAVLRSCLKHVQCTGYVDVS